MKKYLHSLFFTLAFASNLFGQSTFVKQWDSRFGGTGNEELHTFQQTSDGGFILGGWSNSNISGDKTQPNWDLMSFTYDYWIIKVDSSGNKQWDKRFGGTSGDFFYSLNQTDDGGYILGGSSNSGINGDKTQLNWDTTSYGIDYWIIKIDSAGNKQWDKRFGGTSQDVLNYVNQTLDRGYILGGTSKSPVSGDKTESNWDTTNFSYDYWIVKTDSLGTKQWDKKLGGTYEERFIKVEQTPDGGYILGGSSSSGLNGDKTQLNWDTTNNSNDYWIVKIDSLGNKQWDKRFGGNNWDWLGDLQIANDNGYILGGYSASGITGDKTQALWDTTSDLLYRGDYWIVKINSLGDIQWEKAFGGINWEDDFRSISKTNDSGYLISGTSYSPLSGDKTENNLGIEQGWILKIDSLGTTHWDKTIFTNGHDERAFAIPINSDCYAIASYTKAGIGGYKTQSNWDTLSSNTSDFWIVKLCDTTATINVNEITYLNSINVFPNPFSSSIRISMIGHNTKCATFTLNNLLGQTLYTDNQNNFNSSYSKEINLSFLALGIYVLILNMDGEITVRKIVKE